MISELYQKVLENELGRARYLLLLMIVGTWQILKQTKLEILAEALPIPILFESRRKKLKRFLKLEILGEVKSIIGEVEVGQKQSRELGLEGKTPISPGLKKCCLRACAKTSYQQAEEDLVEFMGIRVGHSTLHRRPQF